MAIVGRELRKAIARAPRGCAIRAAANQKRHYLVINPDAEMNFDITRRLVYNDFRGVLTDYKGQPVVLDMQKKNWILTSAVEKLPRRVEGAQYARLLCLASHLKNLTAGKQIHRHIVLSGRKREEHLAHYIVKMYLDCGSLEDAKKLFHGLPGMDSLTWRYMFYTSAKLGDYAEVFKLHRCMRQEGNIFEKRVLLTTVFVCANWGDLDYAREIHSDIVEAGLDSDFIVANALITLYCKCGRLDIATLVFETIAAPNITSWSALMGGYIRHGYYDDALSLFHKLNVEGLELKASAYACALSACVNPTYLKEGQYLHYCLKLSELDTELIAGSALVKMYGRCGKLYDAQRVFDGVANRNVITWTNMIDAYVHRGMPEQAFRVYEAMQLERVLPNKITLMTLLRACSGPELLEKGKLFHCQALNAGMESDPKMAVAIIDMYSSCKSLQDARRVFRKLHQGRSCVWNAIVEAHLDNGYSTEALKLFRKMQLEGVQPDSESYALSFNACENLRALAEAKRIQSSMEGSNLQLDVVVGTSALKCYGKCASLQDLQRTFNSINRGKLESWNVGIHSYVEAGHPRQAAELFHTMMLEGAPPDAETFVAVIPAMQSLEGSKFIHKWAVESGLDMVTDVGNALLAMAGKLKALRLANRTFEAMPVVDAVSWTRIMAAYNECGFSSEPIQLFRDMQRSGVRPIRETFVTALDAVAELESISAGDYVHRLAQEAGYGSDPVVGSALVKVYSKCSSLEEARDVFDTIEPKTLGCFKAMVSACFQQEQYQEAVDVFERMQTKPDGEILATVIQAVTTLGDLDQGEEIYARFSDQKLRSSVVVAEALLDMYSKLGGLESAKATFDGLLPLPSVRSWNSLVSAYARHGQHQQAAKTFNQMLQEGVKPNSSSFDLVSAELGRPAGFYDFQ